MTSLTALSAGTYSVTVNDVTNLCPAILTFTLTDSPGPSFTYTQVDETCGESNGSITVVATGGTPPYAYDWDNDATGDFDDPATLTGLGAGDFTVVVRDANGCTVSYACR